jgi:hypothetical protein
MSNNFFNATGNPATASRALSAQVRAEFSSVEAGFLEVQDVVTAAINGSAVYAVDSGAANAYVVTVGTVDAAAYINTYTDGLMLRVRTANAARAPRRSTSTRWAPSPSCARTAPLCKRATS